MKTPLALLQLTHKKVRLLVAIAGITFADILMFMQLGFRDALFNSSVRLHKSIKGDIFLLSSQSDTLVGLNSFSHRRLYEILGLEGVQSVTPIYVGFAFWKNPETRNNRNILILGINPANNPLSLPGVNENLDKIKLEDTVLFDSLSRDEFGSITEDYNAGKAIKTEVARREIKVGGLFTLGTSFGADGNLITSDVNFFRLFPEREKGLIDVGVVKLESEASLDLTLAKIRNILSQGDIQVFAKEEFINYEKSYWQNRTTIGFIFAFGTVMGFIVGMVIVYQILYTDVADNLPEYATLKAMGYTDLYLLTVVFQEALVLALVGFIPGFSIAMFLYYNTAKATGLPIIMTLTRGVGVLILTLIMCCFSGGITVGKLRSADPADIF